MERQVMVWGKPVTIMVFQKSKSVWLARGIYMDQQIETKGASPSQAANLWADAAKYKGG